MNFHYDAGVLASTTVKERAILELFVEKEYESRMRLNLDQVWGPLERLTSDSTLNVRANALHTSFVVYFGHGKYGELARFRSRFLYNLAQNYRVEELETMIELIGFRETYKAIRPFSNELPS